MLDKINQIFDFNQKTLNIYSKRQEILASNIANSDTPGYQSVDINFNNELKKVLKKTDKKTKIFLKKTSSKHFNKKNQNLLPLEIIPVISNQIKPDGNTVNMDRERVEFLNNSLKYQSSLAFIKNDIKNIMSVLKG